MSMPVRSGWAGTTEFDVNHLDIHALQGTEPQGETYLHLRALGQGDTMVVQTPRGRGDDGGQRPL